MARGRTIVTSLSYNFPFDIVFVAVISAKEKVKYSLA